MKRISFIFILASVLFLSACGGGSGADDRLFLTIATGGYLGVYYPLGASLANCTKPNSGEPKPPCKPRGASVENINLLDQKRAELAIIMGDAASQAYEGTGPFDKKVQSFAAVASLHPNYVQVITTKNSGIKTIEDLKGKRVGVWAPNSGVGIRCLVRHPEAHGMSYDDFEEDFLSYSEAIDGIKNGTVDAAFVTSGIPNPAVTDLSTTHEVKVIPIKGKGMKKLKELYPYYAENTIPKGTYGNKKDVPTASIMNLLVVQRIWMKRRYTSLTKTMFENLKIRRAPQCRQSDPTGDGEGLRSYPLPHPGAEKYFKEAGAK